MSEALSQEELATLQQLEVSLWQAQTRFDKNYMDATLAPDFYEIGRSGRMHSRESILLSASASDDKNIDITLPLPNFAIRLLTADVVQITYDSEVIYSDQLEKAHRSSIWTRKAKGWQLRFHQGTAF